MGGPKLGRVKALLEIVGSVLVACLGVVAYVVYVNTRADTLAVAIERGSCISATT